MLQDLLPIRWIIISSKVWLQLATQNLQSRTLSDTVCSHQSQHLSGPRHGQPVKLEAIRRITMSDLALQIGGKVDDVDGIKRTLLWANTATNAKALRNKGDLRLGGNFDTELAGSDDGA